jgi:hypothetical protein
MGAPRVVVKLAAFNAIRNSAEVVALLEAEGQRIAAAANAAVTSRTDTSEDPFGVNTVHNASRAVTFVHTTSYDGIVAEATNRALTRAVGAG